MTEDISRFWQAYDELSGTADSVERVATLQRGYLDPGTEGLRTFTEAFSLSSRSLLAAVDSLHAYYEYLRDATLGFPGATDQVKLRDVFDAWQRLYPKVRWPDLFFVIGNTETAGTITSAGMVIGAETVARSSSDIQSFMPQYLVEADISRDTLPAIVAHELAHAQQKYYPGSQTVLFWVILEGGAELLCELVTGRIVHEQLRSYGEQHEAELWAELQSTQDELGKGSWFAGPGSGRPGGLGYYMGYKIVKSYYDRQTDPAQAIDDLLNIDDYRQFLRDSGYGGGLE